VHSIRKSGANIRHRKSAAKDKAPKDDLEEARVAGLSGGTFAAILLHPLCSRPLRFMGFLDAPLTAMMSLSPGPRLKDKMTGTNAVSLGKAIQELSPNANAKAEGKKANKQANQDMNAAESES